MSLSDSQLEAVNSLLEAEHLLFGRGVQEALLLMRDRQVRLGKLGYRDFLKLDRIRRYYGEICDIQKKIREYSPKGRMYKKLARRSQWLEAAIARALFRLCPTPVV